MKDSSWREIMWVRMEVLVLFDKHHVALSLKEGPCPWANSQGCTQSP